MKKLTEIEIASWRKKLKEGYFTKGQVVGTLATIYGLDLEEMWQRIDKKLTAKCGPQAKSFLALRGIHKIDYSMDIPACLLPVLADEMKLSPEDHRLLLGIYFCSYGQSYHRARSFDRALEFGNINRADFVALYNAIHATSPTALKMNESLLKIIIEEKPVPKAMAEKLARVFEEGYKHPEVLKEAREVSKAKKTIPRFFARVPWFDKGTLQNFVEDMGGLPPEMKPATSFVEATGTAPTPPDGKKAPYVKPYSSITILAEGEEPAHHHGARKGYTGADMSRVNDPRGRKRY